MKLIIQIPCFNEELYLPLTYKDLPKNIHGIDKIEYLVIDDGSNDKTYEIAKELGIHHIIKLGSNRGLAKAFKSGIEYCLMQGADIVVNTDGDNQYCGRDIEKLIIPILNSEADMVIGCRPIRKHQEFSVMKKFLQILGSWVVRKISRTRVSDVTSGFRAYSREICLRLNLVSNYSHTIETIIQVGNSGLRISNVDIQVNKKNRASRLFKSIPQFIFFSSGTITKMFMYYSPGRFYTLISSLFFIPAFFLGLRFIYLVFFTYNPGRTYIPSLILLSILVVFGIILISLGLIGEKFKIIRHTQNEVLYLIKKSRFDK